MSVLSALCQSYVADNVNIGANAVVLSDVPAGITAVGIPAKILASTNNDENA
jgi:serine O-acetyltransferase